MASKVEDGIPFPKILLKETGSLVQGKNLQAMNYVYVLVNDKGKHYIGSCKDLLVRLKQHNQNRVCSTKNKGPYRIIYQESFSTKTEALKREKELKRYKGNSVFKRIIEKSVPIV